MPLASVQMVIMGFLASYILTPRIYYFCSAKVLTTRDNCLIALLISSCVLFLWLGLAPKKRPKDP